ncbi:MAG: hypothetical protein V5783_00005 [Pontiella sp.]
MKNMIWSVLILSMILSLGSMAEMHAFELPDGRILEAELVDYNSRQGLVTLKRTDGKRIPVKPSIFIEKDQIYIRDWCAARAFLSDSTLKIQADDDVVKSWKEEETMDVRYTDGSVEKEYIHNVIKYEDVAYNISFKNMGEVAINGLVLEYCVYYEQSTMCWEEKPKVELKTSYGKKEIPELRVKQSAEVTTKTVMIYEDDINPIDMRDGDQRRPGKGEILGMHVRVTMKGGDASSIRTVSVPENFSLEEYPWSTVSSPNSRKPYRR